MNGMDEPTPGQQLGNLVGAVFVGGFVGLLALAGIMHIWSILTR